MSDGAFASPVADWCYWRGSSSRRLGLTDHSTGRQLRAVRSCCGVEAMEEVAERVRRKGSRVNCKHLELNANTGRFAQRRMACKLTKHILIYLHRVWRRWIGTVSLSSVLEPVADLGVG